MLRQKKSHRRTRVFRGGAAAGMAAPTSYDPAAKAERPVVCVDWCDAQAYCRAAGKRLCGRIQTGASLPWK